MKIYPYYDDMSTVHIKQELDNISIFEWLKSYDERITRLQDEMVWVKSKINELENKNS